MKYLLITTILFWVLSLWAYITPAKSPDDFLAPLVYLVLGGISIVLTIIYNALAFWNHSFF